MGHGSYVNSVAISVDQKYIVSCGDDKTSRIWNAETGQLIRTVVGHESYINSVAVSSDMKFFASGSDDSIIKLWNLETR